jgi:hypothetical protein
MYISLFSSISDFHVLEFWSVYHGIQQLAEVVLSEIDFARLHRLHLPFKEHRVLDGRM